MSTEAEVQKKTKEKRGRKLKLTESLIAEVCKYVGAGVPLEVAFECLQLSRATCYAWQAKARAGEEPYADAFDRFTKAKATIISALAHRRVKLALKSESPEVITRVLESLSPADFPRVAATINANVKSDNKHEHKGAVGVEVAGALTVKGADAIRRDVLFGGKSIDDVRGELEAKKKKGGA